MRSVKELLANCGLDVPPQAIMTDGRLLAGKGPLWPVRSPIDGSQLAAFPLATASQVEVMVERASEAFWRWRTVPAPRRGELVRRLGELLRRHKDDLSELVTLETGKIQQEASGEVQEMIDVCDFAVGLSRQLHGLTIASERPAHRLMEQWHPLGPVGVITAFNFPVAVWAWNSALALVCGDPVIWKPSEKTPLTALACQALLSQAVGTIQEAPRGLSSIVVGDATIGRQLASEARLPLISATGSVPMGRAVGQIVASRLGRSLLELGGNNGMIVCPSADIALALRAIVFSAVGTAGQRCTSLRRLIVHADVRQELVDRLVQVYQRLPIGDPRDPGTLVGPLIDEEAWQAMQRAIDRAVEEGGQLLVGGERLSSGVPAGGVYVRPAILAVSPDISVIAQETFAPVLYVMQYEQLDEAIRIHNDVPQGLASAIFTRELREAERFLSATGSDCGIANVNIGTSGAEIGGAFGGEKETGGGRESGSDSWKNYMRRATNTINYSDQLPLAQGIRFDLETP